MVVDRCVILRGAGHDTRMFITRRRITGELDIVPTHANIRNHAISRDD
jgi:hypothetical protein